MTAYECEDCEKPYQSIKAAMLCKCDTEDVYGYPKRECGHDWLD